MAELGTISLDDFLEDESINELQTHLIPNEGFKSEAYVDPLRVAYDENKPGQYYEFPVIQDTTGQKRTKFKPSSNFSTESLQQNSDGTLQFQGITLPNDDRVIQAGNAIKMRNQAYVEETQRLQNLYKQGQLKDEDFAQYHRRYAPTIGTGVSSYKFNNVARALGDKNKAYELFLGLQPLDPKDPANTQILKDIVKNDIDPAYTSSVGAEKYSTLPPKLKLALRDTAYNSQGATKYDIVAKYIKDTPVDQLDPIQIIAGLKKTRQFQSQMQASRKKAIFDLILNMRQP